jgi:hypothetical protein
MWFYFPDTLGKPLEETAALFGDADEVVGYMRDIAVTEGDLDQVEGFGDNKEGSGVSHVEKAEGGA